MEEKVIIKSEHYNIKKIIIPIVILSILVSVCMMCGYYFDNRSRHMERYEDRVESQNTYIEGYNSILESFETEDVIEHACGKYTYGVISQEYTKDEFINLHPDAESYARCRELGFWYDNFNEYVQDRKPTFLYIDEIGISAIPLSAILIVLFVYWWLASYSLTVSDKRIYGKTAFGKRVDLPVDSISAVATSSLKGISVATASGKIIFKLIKNRDEIHSEISKLIISRQEKVNNTAAEQKPQITDELKKFKELLDSGVITQDEFDAKKKELLGL